MRLDCEEIIPKNIRHFARYRKGDFARKGTLLETIEQHRSYFHSDWQYRIVQENTRHYLNAYILYIVEKRGYICLIF